MHTLDISISLRRRIPGSRCERESSGAFFLTFILYLGAAQMEKLDREYQLRILKAAADIYPQPLFVHEELAGRSGGDIELNCAYLEEHDLVRLNWVGSENSGRVVLSVLVTATGMDYLANDGGLPAILNVLTIRLESDAVKKIFIERVRSANGDRTAKDKAGVKLR
ncbi:MAG TPA: hypothetical protein VHW73_12665 [Rudaea sp.]|nr:hypothetical protein [Rudaea sp.]